MQAVKVESAEIIGVAPYFDFHVPLYNHYWAGGLWHHNTGKSLAAKATANELGIPLLKADAGRWYGSLVGQSEQNLRSVLETAEAMAPCVLWLDEIN